MNNETLLAQLRRGDPADLDAVAIETEEGLRYTWRDLDRATSMLANVFVSIHLSEGSRVATHIDPSVEGLLLHLGIRRSGHVHERMNADPHQPGEIARFFADEKPAVVVCRGRDFPWISKLAFREGVGHVFTLNENRTGSLLDRAAQMPDRTEALLPPLLADLPAFLDL